MKGPARPPTRPSRAARSGVLAFSFRTHCASTIRACAIISPASSGSCCRLRHHPHRRNRCHPLRRYPPGKTTATFSDASPGPTTTSFVSRGLRSAARWGAARRRVRLRVPAGNVRRSDPRGGFDNDDFEYGATRVMTLMATGDGRPVPLASACSRMRQAASASCSDGYRPGFSLFKVKSTNTRIQRRWRVMRPLGAHYGLRADARFFRTIQEQLPESEVDLAIGC